MRKKLTDQDIDLIFRKKAFYFENPYGNATVVSINFSSKEIADAFINEIINNVKLKKRVKEEIKETDGDIDRTREHNLLKKLWGKREN